MTRYIFWLGTRLGMKLPTGDDYEAGHSTAYRRQDCNFQNLKTRLQAMIY
jgi:hypothetical protein